MYYLLTHFHSLLLCLVFTLLVVIVSCLAFNKIRKKLDRKSLEENSEAVGIIFGVISLLYSLIIAFVLVAVWEDYEELNSTITNEADKLDVIMIHAHELPDSLSQNIYSHIKKYTGRVIEVEWLTNPKYKIVNTELTSMRYDIFKMHLTDETQQDVLKEINNDMNDLSDLRHERLSHNYSHVPDLVWVILIFGTLIILFCSMLFYMSSVRLQFALISMLAIIISLCLFLLFTLDHPFEGTSAVKSEPYLEVLKTVNNLIH